MLTEPLPSTLDARKAAVRQASVSGVLSPAELPRLRDLLASENGEISAELQFSRDEEYRYLVQVRARATVEVVCQRCLGALQISLASDNTLAFVWTDEQASQLPRELDPVIAGDEPCNLRELVEDELMLAMPAFSYHDTEQCKQILADYDGSSAVIGSEQAKPNPFDVLARLKRGEEH